ncbi:VPLPA-CTERM sorting domain-containing protein [Pararhodobacter sp. SW119]|uniref:VPLPA-CTERM sorting domain-containing protein n=1 Tax=Pararhodobacter sp. SW119 TaxID=2780075 RepID=UPI001ADFE1F5|nr:VPLPA-CTERM sorting domain-containing protein [Pararhodobacter sp. SW119]
MRRRSSLKGTGLVLAGAAFSAGTAWAAPVSAPEGATGRGAPIAQQFLDDHGDNVSLLATQMGYSCVASRPIQIRDSRYIGADGAEVSFDEVVRSPASSVQAIARQGQPVAFRVQLKYTPDAAHPIELQIGSTTLDLDGTVERSRDSLWLTGATAEALAAALADGTAPRLRATSAETGREVIDRIDPPAMAALDTCLETLEALEAAAAEEAGADAAETEPETTAAPDAESDTATLVVVDEAAEPSLPVPVSSFRLEFRARADAEARVTEAQLQHCRMRDIPDEVFLGRLSKVTGFFAQTQDVYVAFDDEGRVQRAYVPGIFDSDVTAGVNTAWVSMAADSNLPDQPNEVRGCLGVLGVADEICVYPDEDLEDGYILAECGVLGVVDDRDGPLLPLVEWTTPVGMIGPGPGVGIFSSPPPRTTSFPPGGGGGVPPTLFPPPGGGGGGGTPPTPDDPDGGPPDRPEIPPIPLPAAIWLLLGALAGLPGLRILNRRRAAG